MAIPHGKEMPGRRDPINLTLIQEVPPPEALAPLPALMPGFVGREAKLAEIKGLLDPAAKAPAVLAIAGMAGAGKTALAIHAAHAARQAGWFPGGVPFIDLHGYSELPVRPDQALDTLLSGLGIAAGRRQAGVDAQATLYRSALARLDPVLIVADNASSEAQVEPLLPGPGPHRMVVTSRHTLARLGARLVDVEALDVNAGVKLLDVALRAARPDDARIGAGQVQAERADLGLEAPRPQLLELPRRRLRCGHDLPPRVRRTTRIRITSFAQHRQP
jgi:hypothetical protein